MLVALFGKAFVLVVLAFFVLAPARYAVMRWMPDGKLKRILLFRYTERRWYGRKWNAPANDRIVGDVGGQTSGKRD